MKTYASLHISLETGIHVHLYAEENGISIPGLGHSGCVLDSWEEGVDAKTKSGRVSKEERPLIPRDQL